MSILDKIVKSVYDPQEQLQQKPQESVVAEETEVQIPVSSGNSDSKTVTELNNALDESIKDPDDKNDYRNFMKAVTKTAKLIPLEETRFKVSAENLNVNSSALVNSSLYYISVLNKEKTNFEALMQDKLAAEVESKKIKISELERDVKDSKDEILRLQELINKNTEEVAKLSGQAQEAELKIKMKISNFQASFESVKAGIQSDVQKIKTYLGVEK